MVQWLAHTSASHSVMCLVSHHGGIEKKKRFTGIHWVSGKLFREKVVCSVILTSLIEYRFVYTKYKYGSNIWSVSIKCVKGPGICLQNTAQIHLVAHFDIELL